MTLGLLEEKVARLEAREELLKEALTKLADAIASAGYNINTDDMMLAYRAVWAFTGFDPKAANPGDVIRKEQERDPTNDLPPYTYINPRQG